MGRLNQKKYTAVHIQIFFEYNRPADFESAYAQAIVLL